MSHHHDSHDHEHEAESYASLRTRALESLLVEKGYITSDAIDALVKTYEEDIGPMNGARVVARAWVDPDYKSRLLEDGTEAIAELGFQGAEGSEIVVLENTPGVHNVVVCTLCSCYPWPVLGLPPNWYKSFAYRSRMVIEPRAVLQGIRPGSRRIHRSPGLGQQRRDPLHGPPRKTRGHGEYERGGVVGPRDPGRHGWRSSGPAPGSRGIS